MLKVFRQKGVAKKVLWVVSAIIIISFGFGFGMGQYSDSDKMNATAGKLFGKKISMKEFRSEYMNARDQAILMHGADVDRIMAFLDMETETWTRMMLLKEADRKGIKATDSEVIAFIQSMPFFQTKSTYDNKLYETILSHVFKRVPRDFEESMRGQIRIMKMFQTLTGHIAISDDDVKKEYERRNRKVKASYVLLQPKTFASTITLDPQEVQAYYDAHRQDFLIPESVNTRYLTVPLAEKATADEKKTASLKANELYTKITADGDIDTAAKAAGIKVKESGRFSMDTPDLDLGWPLDVFQQVFQASTSDVLGPVEAKEGFVIIKVIEKNVAYIPDFEKTKTSVADKMTEERSLKTAKEKAESLHTELAQKMQSGLSFSTAAKEANVIVKATPFFGMGDYLDEIGISEDFESSAFALNKDAALSRVVLTAKGPAIIHFDEEQPADMKKFEEVKKDFGASLHQERRTSIMNDMISDVRSRARLESMLDTVKK